MVPEATVESQDDFHYPSEENREQSTANIPLALAVNLTGDTWSAKLENLHTHEVQGVELGEVAFVNWTFVSVIQVKSSPVVVLQRNWRRWGAIVYLQVGPDHQAVDSGVSAQRGDVLAFLRKSVGHVASIDQPSFNFTGKDPSYFGKAASYPNDFLGSQARLSPVTALAQSIAQILENAEFGEADYPTAMNYLPPTNDYVVIGQPTAAVKYQVHRWLV